MRRITRIVLKNHLLPLKPQEPFRLGPYPTVSRPFPIQARSSAIMVIVFVSAFFCPLRVFGAVSFQTTTPLNAGQYPNSMAVGDFNQDGIADLAVGSMYTYQNPFPNPFAQNISVLLGKGGGSFGELTTYSTATGPSTVAIGDFNNDGKPDIAVANFYSLNISVLPGDGAGKFGTRKNFYGGDNNSSIAIADFNQDGNADLAVTRITANSVGVYLGNGAFGFSHGGDFAVGRSPLSIKVSEFNGDGIPDIAVANSNSFTSGVSVLLGNGTGGFAAPYSINLGGRALRVDTGDFNRDGFADLAVLVTNDLGNAFGVMVLLGTGTGGFGIHGYFAGDSYYQSVVTGDFNGDGLTDLATLNSPTVGPGLSVMLGDGDGDFGDPIPFATTVAHPTSLVVGDLNGDGKPDLAAGDANGTTISLLLNNSAPFITTLVDSTFTTGTEGWAQFGTTNVNQSATYDPANGALTAQINSVAVDGDYRIIGWFSDAADTLNYASIGTGHYVRAKYYIYATGQTGSAVNEIPNFRVRIANRFAVSSILKVGNHLNTDPEATQLAQDIRPSTSPASPSIYRVDLDPIDVPQLVSNPTTESFLRLFEVYEPDAQANGIVGMTESVVGSYAKLPDFNTTVTVSQNGLIKSYRPGAADGGDFGNGNIISSNSAITIAKYFNGTAETTGPMPTVTISNAGVTLETLSVPSDRFGAAALDVFNDKSDQSNRLTRARVEPGKLYKIRFHATSTKASNTQPVIRFRARTIKFQYSASLEIGGSQAASVANNTLAAQALPGIGNQIPAIDRINPAENGGWYNVLMVTPMNPDIQAYQPNLYAQDGPGVNTGGPSNKKSRRDIQFGIDLIDTFTPLPTSALESGQMTVDRVDIEKYDQVTD